MHSFWDDPVRDILAYLCQPCTSAKSVVAIAHNAKALDLHFIVNRSIFLKWQTEFIVIDVNIMCMKVKYITFLDSLNDLPFPLRKLPDAFGLTSRKSWYPLYFNMVENLRYVRAIKDYLLRFLRNAAL
jgi:hypothetical protein